MAGKEKAGSFVYMEKKGNLPAVPCGMQDGVKDMKQFICAVLTAALLLCACGALAQAAYVDNGSDPASRLNMRAEPSREAASLGRFMSGTQVEIVADAGNGWSQVVIGGGMNSFGGYMMTDYLRADAAGVLDAREDRLVVSPYGTQSVVLRDRPGNAYDAVMMLEVGTAVKVIGVTGEFCYVLAGDMTVGCLAADELTE